ncbi:hypothetical protein BBJ28_00001341 [Nothophytophthora sp. Chile5]|nr:hypothetical protein BBJ28_00001341 [Nothophytophthora sp. Chile5]
MEPFRDDVSESADGEGDAGTVTDADLFSSQEDASSADFLGTRGAGACALELDTAVHSEATDDVEVFKMKTATYVVAEDSDDSPTKETEGMQQTPKKSAICVDHIFSFDTANLRLNGKKEVRLSAIKDSVHGLITFEPICMRIIDTLQVRLFQRLRNLHQLGAANFVYIGATHSRFEHCLGVAYLAEQMMESILVHQPWLPITKTDVLCIKIAGLCHDLGHGPFSHVFDGIFFEQLRRKKLISDSYKWTHEQGSIDMLDHLLAANHIDVAAYGLTDQDVVFIKELIIGGPLPGSDGALHGRPSSDQRFMYDIVNNAHSGLDVDKLDYFMRDALHTGAKMSCDPDLLIRNARVLVDRDDNEKKMAICYPEKLVGQVMQAFHTRFELHQAVYQHKAVRAIEYMICDIFLASNSHLTIKGKRFSEIMNSMEAYQHLDDRVLLKIQESEGTELQEARSILNRIYTGPYYNVIGKTAFTDHSYRKTEDMLLNEVLRCSKRRSLIDEKDGVILEFMRIHYGKGKDDPLKYVRFYSKNAVASTTCYPLPVAAYDMFSPRKFQERSIRILVKEPRLAAPVREAFERWSRKFNKSQVFPLELHTDRQML